MYRSLVMTASVVAAGFCLWTSGANAGGASPNETEPCASLVRTLEADIKSLKQLLGHSSSGLEDFSKSKKSKKSTDRLTHGRELDDQVVARADTSAENRKAAARQRGQVDALNGMLPGFGCRSLDIDAELRK